MVVDYISGEMEHTMKSSRSFMSIDDFGLVFGRRVNGINHFMASALSKAPCMPWSVESLFIKKNKKQSPFEQAMVITEL